MTSAERHGELRSAVRELLSLTNYALQGGDTVRLILLRSRLEGLVGGQRAKL